MKCIRVGQHTIKIQLAEKLLERCTLMVLARGVAGLCDRHTHGSGVERHLGNECRATTPGGLDRHSQSGFAAWSLADRAVRQQRKLSHPTGDPSTNPPGVVLVPLTPEGAAAW